MKDLKLSLVIENDLENKIITLSSLRQGDLGVLKLNNIEECLFLIEQINQCLQEWK